MAALLYDLQLTFRVTEQVKKGVRVTHSYYTEAEAFSVAGGSDRCIWRDGRGKIGDADVMSEFYQARQFQNITIQKHLSRDTLVIERIYYLDLPFDFTFVVQSLSHASRFRCLQMDVQNARLAGPPNRSARTEALFIKFADPKIFYWHDKVRGSTSTVVKEEI